MKILSVIETAIYVADLDATEDFYHRIIGLKVIGKEADRHVFFQVGDSNVLLAFNPSSTLKGDWFYSMSAEIQIHRKSYYDQLIPMIRVGL